MLVNFVHSQSASPHGIDLFWVCDIIIAWEQKHKCDILRYTTLSRQLKALENEGLIVRKEYQQIPPKVEYSLSEIGEKFRCVLPELESWGYEYIEYMRAQPKKDANDAE